ncbi:MAG: cyclase family protein [Rubrobacteraceae bacterium]|uniref:cyclase family protein n=1 Tax=Rubrobacter TaxID=42255 RepID=UPI002361B087|nr:MULTISPECIES: cyclase family protein [Rubrobacter]MBX6762492.1 cyclase family protein [Rubrobacteraceae bacterium]MCL6438621.1 cyclase family protein [Rubrobacteraceae bacterium]
MSRLVDLSMPVHKDMITFPRIPAPSLLMYETWQEFAEGVGADKYGVDSLTASYLVIQSDHAGTHMDALKHIRPDGPAAEEIPLEYCYSDGVVLDFRHLEKGAGITPSDIDQALEKIGYELKERDIVLIQTGASAYNDQERYLTDHCGMTAEATKYLISRGIRLMGTDAPTFDPPVWAMFERKKFWEAHRVMWEEDYWHIENLTNLDQLPPYGFKLSAFPIKWTGTTGAPLRAVAILDE